MDRKLLDILCCPASKQPLALLDRGELQALNQAIAKGSVLRLDGNSQGQLLTEGLITRDRKIIYRVDDGIPVLLADEGIATAAVPDFPL